jgi:hypothetical protein
MYGSVLSGGLGGHVYGAGGWDGGVWSGEVEPESKWPLWDVMKFPSADQLRHLKTFVFSANDAPASYQDLIPRTQQLSPNRTDTEKLRTTTGWAFAAGTADHSVYLLYFERDCAPAVLKDLPVGARYTVSWFNPQNGRWSASPVVTVSTNGQLQIPGFPSSAGPSQSDWALKLKRQP